jgi:hypothetical protein
MATYTVGEQGATVFDDCGRLLMYLKPGAVVVPGTTSDTLEPRTPEQEYPTRRGYDDKVVRPERRGEAAQPRGSTVREGPGS